MRRLRAWISCFADLFQRRKREQDLADEIEGNLLMHVDENIRSGMPPDEARRLARLSLGSMEALKETIRDRRRIPFLETVVRDTSYALRMLLQNKGWSTVAIVILAVGVGANSAIFAFVSDYALKKLPVTNPDELVVFRWYGENTAKSLYSEDLYIAQSNQQAGAAFSFDSFQQFRAHDQELLEIFAFASSADLNVFANGEAEYATGQFVSGDYYSALGVPAELGRMLNVQDDVETAQPAVVISHQYWERRFAKDPRAIGAAISINNVAFTIAGVTQSRFVDVTKRGSMNAPDITIPLTLEPRVQPRGGSWLKYPQNWWLVVMGRLKPGVDRQQAEARLGPVFDQSARDGWAAFVSTMNAEQRAMPELGGRHIRVPRLRIVPAAHGVSDAHESVLAYLAIFTAIFAIVLIIVCVNVSNLLLSRTAGRRKEIAVRMAIGASRFRVIRQLLTESLILAAIGGTLGVVFANWAMIALQRPISRVASYEVPGVSLTVLLVSGALTVLAGLFFGIVPALRATQPRGVRSLAEIGGRFSESQSRLGKALLIVQVALSIVLLVAAGLFLRTLRNLENVDVGFNPANIALFSVSPGASGYTGERAAELLGEIKRRLQDLPGVQSASSAGPLSLLSDGEIGSDVYIDGSSPQRQANVIGVEDDFFETIGIPLKLGRRFTSTDTATSRRVAIVNETFARTFLPNSNPIGKRFSARPQAPTAAQTEIIGVVADTKVNSLRDAAPPMFYRPLTQMSTPTRAVVIRTKGDPKLVMPTIREAMRQIDPRLPLRDFSTSLDRIGRAYLLNERMLAIASMAFGAIALAIAMIGLFGLMSYSVARRTKEIGIRMALGAERRSVLKSVLSEALVLAVAGVVIGTVVSLGVLQPIESLLYGLAPYDVLTVVTVALLMLSVSLIAGYLPARRASRVDPMISLRHE